MKRTLALALCVVLALACAPVSRAAAQQPYTLYLTSAPALGKSGYVSGYALGADGSRVSDTQAFRVAAYLYAGGQYYIKPTEAQPFVTLREDGSFSLQLTTHVNDYGVALAHVLLLPATFTPQSYQYSAALAASYCSVAVTRTENGYTLDPPNDEALLAKKLVFSDEFSGSAVDTRRWAYDVGNGDWGWGNGEKQYYTKKNATVEGGVLSITARKESLKGFGYTSSRLKSRFSLSSGYVEVRARCDGGNTLWPAIWMLPVNTGKGWPYTGEIDISEAKGRLPGQLYNTIHYYANSTASVGSGATAYAVGDMSDWHTYGLQWTRSSLTWLVDGAVTYSLSGWSPSNAAFPAPFDKPFYLILNLAVGGAFDQNGQTPPSLDADPATFKTPKQLQVDYVRMYEFVQLDPPVEAQFTMQGDATVVLSQEDTLQLVASSYPTDIASWTVRDARHPELASTDIAQIDANGLLRCRKSGRVIVTAANGAGEERSCVVSIRRSEDQLALPAELVQLKARAFLNCADIVEVSVPESVTSIGESAFEGCTDLFVLTVHGADTVIGADAFKGCDALMLCCKEGSQAQRYAIDNAIPYTIIP